MAANPEQITLTPVLRALVSNGLGNEAQLLALASDPGRGKKPLLFYAVEKGAVSAPALMAHLSQRYNMPMLDLDAVMIDDLLIRRIDKNLMSRYFVLPLSKRGETLYLAMADPTDFKAVEDIKFNTGLQVVPILVEANKLMRAVNLANNAGTGIDDVFLEKSSDVNTDDAQEEFDLSKDSDGTVDDAPVVRFVQQLLLDAIQRGVSDIHLEPYEKDFRVRYRLDGVLQDALHPPLALRDGVTSRLKILCRLDISERRLPQDGRLRVRVP
ncbi:GspE/PulE family protein, partial [Acidithiobacillus thiooxidans]